MLINQYIEAGIIELKDPENANIPVDYHILNISVSRNILTEVEKTREHKVADFLFKEYKKFFRENRSISPLSCSKALWMLGKYVCSRGGCDDFCPFENPCDKYINPNRYFKGGMIIIEQSG